jgi:beta-galactosidase
MNSARTCISLDGEWTLAPDPGNRGREEAWWRNPPDTGALSVRVPAVWDLWLPDYDGAGWYFRRFGAPSETLDRFFELRFEAADYYAEVWLNETYLGDHEGGYTPFSFDVSGMVREKDNLLAVRIIDPHGEDGFEEFNTLDIPCAKEKGYWSFAGIWGSVRLEAKAHTHIQDIFIQPDIRRKRIQVTAQCSGPGTRSLEIEGTGNQIQGAKETLVLDFPDFELWAPDTPVLYTLRADLMGENGDFDSIRIPFGMREFTIKDNRFHLNGHPCYIRAVLQQPDYPCSLAAPESAGMARREIELAKEAGFNMIRMHIKTPPPIALQLADEIGMLIYEEPPIGWIRKSDHMKQRCENEVREMILRDRNHPAVVIWGMLNETGNADYVTGGGAQLIKDELCMLARSLDPSRVIIDDSGGVNATREPARYIRPYRDEFEAYDDLHVYQRTPVDHDIERYYRHNAETEKLAFLSEFGFGGPEDLEKTIAAYGADAETAKDARFLKKMYEAAQQGFGERNLDRVFGSFRNFLKAARLLQCDAARYQIDAIRSNPNLAGYCYTQLSDAGHEFCAGILDRWRKPKPVFRMLKQLQRPVRPLIQMARTNLVPREEVNVTILLANEDRLEGRADLSLQVVGPTNQVLWKKKRNVKVPRHGRELWNGVISASGSAGSHRFVVRLIQDHKAVAEASVEFHVLEPAKAAEAPVHILDPHGEWQKKCAAFARPQNMLAPVHIIPPLANTIRAYPENDLMQMLAQVRDGAVAIFFEPPADWNDLAERLEGDVRATARDATGAFLPVCHYARLHPVFDGLPARALMRQPYRNVIPAKTFEEKSDEDIAGAWDAAPIAAGNYMLDESAWWGSDILVRRHGSGRIVMTHLRVMPHLGDDPAAGRILVNLINHFSRRSVPGESPQPVTRPAVEWLFRERRKVRRWMVIGEFPNRDGNGRDTAWPPEQEIEFGATYPGWYKAIRWKRWYARADHGYRIDLQEAFSPVFEYYPRFDYATGYAYAEFSCEKRQHASMLIGFQNAMKIWLNGNLVYESDTQVPHDQFEETVEKVLCRQGRNTLLVKCVKTPGPFRFSIDFQKPGREELAITWWK